MRIEGTTYAVNTHIITDMHKKKSIRLSISNQEVPYDNIAIILDGNQAMVIAQVIALGAKALDDAINEMLLLDRMREIEKAQAQGE